MRFEQLIIESIENATRLNSVRSLLLGGIAGSGGGTGGPPGGFIGTLPQTKVSYDLSELSASGTPSSGMSILDNLNHIRYRIEQLEAGSGVVVSGGSGHTIQDEGSDLPQRTYLDFVGDGVVVTDDLANDKTIVTISGVVGSGSGDMSKSTYDTNNNGTVDNAEALNGHADTYFQPALIFTPEDVANKDATTTLGTSDTLYPTQKAVKTYVDTAISGVSVSGVVLSGYMEKSIYDIDNDGIVDNSEALEGHDAAYFQTALIYTPEDVANKSTSTSLGVSDTLYPSQKAVKTYVDAAISGIPVSSGSGGHTIKDSSTTFTQRESLKFVGSGVIVTDDSGGNNTVITIAGGSGTPASGLGYASVVEDFAGNNSTTHFITGHTVVSGSLGVYLNGIRQEPNVDYTRDSDGLGFTTLFTATSGEVVLADYDYVISGGTEVVLSGYMQKSIYDSNNDGVIDNNIARSGSTTDGHLAVWNGSDANSIKDGGALVSLVSDKKTLTSGDKTITGTSFADIDPGLTITLTTGARRCLVTFVASAKEVSGGALQIDLNIDGNRVGGAFGLSLCSVVNVNMSFTFITDVLTAASHTFKPQARVDSGTGTIYASTTISPIIFAVQELPLKDLS